MYPSRVTNPFFDSRSITSKRDFAGEIATAVRKKGLKFGVYYCSGLDWTFTESRLQQLYESKYPWGPWKIFYNEKPWGGTEHSCYLPQIPNKWWSKDALSGTIMFAGDYTGHNYEYYGLMTQSFT